MTLFMKVYNYKSIMKITLGNLGMLNMKNTSMQETFILLKAKIHFVLNQQKLQFLFKTLFIPYLLYLWGIMLIN